jgi:hypothetical protein
MIMKAVTANQHEAAETPEDIIKSAVCSLEDALQRAYLVHDSINSQCDEVKCEHYFGKSVVLLDVINGIYSAQESLERLAGIKEGGTTI